MLTSRTESSSSNTSTRIGGLAASLRPIGFNEKIQGQQYNGMLDCFRKTVQQEGLRGLMKGVGSPLVGQGIMNGCQFFAYERAKEFVGGGPGVVLSIPQHAVAGIMTGFAISFVDGPVDLFKCKMQAQTATGPEAYRNVFDCAAKIGRQHGVRGIYQGLGATMLRDAPANAFYFSSYEVVKRQLAGPNVPRDQLKSSTTLAAGGVAGFMYWLTMCTYCNFSKH